MLDYHRIQAEKGRDINTKGGRRMKYCPECRHLVNTIKHRYPTETETTIEERCEECKRIIEVTHLPVEGETVV